MNLTADILRPSDLTLSDLGAWADLRASHPDFASPLLSPGFAHAVGGVRADAAVAVFRRAGTVVGVLAHHRRPGGTARPIGAPFSDYHAMITGPAPGFDAVEAIRAAGLTTYAYSGLLDPHALFPAPETTSPTHQVVVDSTPEAYLEGRRARSPKHFKNWRRLEGKAEREIGALSLRSDNDPAAFQLLIDWKRDQLRRTGRHDFLVPHAWTDRLLRRLFEGQDGDVPGLMLTLWAGDQLMCGHFGVREGAVFHPWLASMSPELKAYSPGQAFLSQAVRAMPTLGLETLDLGGGHDHYKAPFASRQGVAGQGCARAAGVRPAAVGRLFGAAADRLGRRETLASMHRRFDHIAQVELSLGGRVRGLALALAAKGPGARASRAEA